MKAFFLILLLAIVTNSVNLVSCDAGRASTAAAADQDMYFIEQSAGAMPFHQIGTVNLRVMKQTQSDAQYSSHLDASEFENLSPNSQQREQSNQQDQKDAGVSGSAIAAVQQQRYMRRFQPIKLESLPFTSEQRDALEQEARQANNKTLYRLRLCRPSSSSSSSSPLTCYAASFLYLQSLLNSSFTVNITLHTNVNNKLQSMSMRATESPSPRLPVNPDQVFESNGIDRLTMWSLVQGIRNAQPPDTETYLTKLRKETEVKEKGAAGDNQSFLQKYWIYIVPFLVIMFLMNLVNPEGGAPGGR